MRYDVCLWCRKVRLDNSYWPYCSEVCEGKAESCAMEPPAEASLDVEELEAADE